MRIACNSCYEQVTSFSEKSYSQALKIDIDGWQEQNKNFYPQHCVCGCHDIRADDDIKVVSEPHHNTVMTYLSEISCPRCGIKVKFTSKTGRYHARINAVNLWKSLEEVGFQLNCLPVGGDRD